MKKPEKTKTQRRERFKPSKIPKKRNVLFELRTADNAALRWRAVKEALQKISAQLIIFNEKSGRGIFRCKLHELAAVKEKFLSLRQIAGIPVAPKTLLTSGTLRKLRSRI